MPRKLHAVTLFAKEKPMFRISYRSDGPFVTELLQSDNANAIAFMNLLPLKVHCLPLGNTKILSNINDEASVLLLVKKLFEYTNIAGTGGDIVTAFINSHQHRPNEREDHDLEELLKKLNLPRTTNPLRDANNEYRSYTSSAYMRSDLAIPTMSSLRDMPASDLVTSTESLVVNPDQVINNERDLAPSAPVTFKYQSVPATPTFSSFQNMSVEDLVAMTGLSTETMTVNIRANVRAEYINDESVTANVSSTLDNRKQHP